MGDKHSSELSLDNPIAIKIFKELIDEMITQRLKSAQFNRMISGKVTNVGSGVADVQLYADGSSIVNLANKTGVTLNVNDEVYVECINGSTSNAYIALKKS